MFTLYNMNMFYVQEINGNFRTFKGIVPNM